MTTGDLRSPSRQRQEDFMDASGQAARAQSHSDWRDAGGASQFKPVVARGPTSGAVDQEAGSEGGGKAALVRAVGKSRASDDSEKSTINLSWPLLCGRAVRCANSSRGVSHPSAGADLRRESDTLGFSPQKPARRAY